MSVKKCPFLNDQINLERKVEGGVYGHRIKLCMCLTEHHKIQNGRHAMEENVIFFIMFQTYLNKSTMKLIVKKKLALICDENLM